MEMSHYDSLLEQLTVRTAAMRDLIVVIIANQARASRNPELIFRQISNGLSKKIDTIDPKEAVEIGTEFLEKVRLEIDWIVGAAQRLAGSRPS